MGLSNGSIVECTPTLRVAVDFWRGRCRSEGVAAHFLTHLHTDHTEGLSNSWAEGRIYCSKASADLLVAKWPRLASRVVPLEVAESSVLSFGCGQTMTVTPLDARHCVGSVMFLFQGPFGSILHTGDFRWEKTEQAELLSQATLRSAVPLTALYLDNTYCNPAYKFSPRAEALKDVLDIVRCHPEHRILIATGNLGKEEILAAAAKETGEQVGLHCPRQQRMALSLLGCDQELFSDERCAVRIRSANRREASALAVSKLNEFRPTVAIVPSGWGGGGGSRLLRPVQYSLHNDFEELQAFVKALRPQRIIPIVSRNTIDPHISTSPQQLLPQQQQQQQQKVSSGGLSVSPPAALRTAGAKQHEMGRSEPREEEAKGAEKCRPANESLASLSVLYLGSLYCLWLFADRIWHCSSRTNAAAAAHAPNEQQQESVASGDGQGRGRLAAAGKLPPEAANRAVLRRLNGRVPSPRSSPAWEALASSIAASRELRKRKLTHRDLSDAQ